MKGFEKYTRQYFVPEGSYDDWMKKDHIEKAPTWCSVDLRDGNQALIIPMSLEEKLEFFEMLVKIGFKEIEVGFPAASETEYEFCRTLIERDMIPDDVAIQVLTQSREHIIKKTFEAVSGCKNAIVHLYNSTSVAQREQVFKKSKREIIDIAVSGAKLFNEYRARTPGNFRFEYSPESFTGTEPEFALEICNAVSEVWKPTPENKVIYNLPVTVSHSMPHVYARQIEYMCKNLNDRDGIIVSLHPHNDRGCAIADTEMGILAGAERVEGTLFGNGERTGNVDIMNLALNLYSQGVDPQLDFSHMNHIKEVYEECTQMKVHPRHPYAGELVFTAFSGSHQDAINKGVNFMAREHSPYWEVPYLPIDPSDLGRQYEPIIRINSQSGKGGAAFVMQQSFGYQLPKAMHPEFGRIVKQACDRLGREITPAEVFDLFRQEYLEVAGPYHLLTYRIFTEDEGEGVVAHFEGTLRFDHETRQLSGRGNGPIDAFYNALGAVGITGYDFVSYNEHAVSGGSDSRAVSYIQLRHNGEIVFGVGMDSNISIATVKGIICAINRASGQHARTH